MLGVPPSDQDRFHFKENMTITSVTELPVTWDS
jgi:hypothetical protein